MKIQISILGNCQLLPLANQLKKNENFCVTYASPYSELARAESFLETIKYCDIFLATLTKNNYRSDIELGTQNIISSLPQKSKFIITPSIYYTGYFPTFGSCKDLDALSYDFEKKEFYFSKYHDYLAIILAQNKITNFDYNTLKLNNFNEIIKKNNENTILELKNREEKCCVRVSDFLEKICYKKVCFYTYNHPCDEILFNLYSKILKKIEDYFNLKLKIIFEKQNLLNNDKTHIHDFIIDYFNLNNKNKMNNKIFNDIIEYYKNKNFSINENSQTYINSMEILKRARAI